ncbi:MAG: hypothetical protein L3J59_15985 [Methylococcaceae bacterium]|nr:hypothetical protein [Methylococcaceae bacterium]
MNKIQKYNKRLLALLLVLSPCSGMANEGLDNMSQLMINQLAHSQRTIEELKSHNLKQEYQLMPKGKAELEKIFGTWFFSYTFNGIKHTDKLVIDDFYESEDGGISASGTLFLNKEGEGKVIVCRELPPKLVSFYGSDYDCFSGSDDTSFHNYNFRISENTVTNGFYGEGDTVEDSAMSIFSKNHSLTGSRGSETPPETSGNNEANFNESSNELIIPVVNYKGSKYRVILQNNHECSL